MPNKASRKTTRAAGKTAGRTAAKRTVAKPILLTGGNPQIAKANGDAPVQAYIGAMPDWKRDVGRRLDTLVTRAVPRVRKAVKWNSPFYGMEGQGWFLSFHVFTRYVKVTFFRGGSLQPVPPGGTGKDARWIDVHEDDLDEAQMTKWIRQAAALPGWDGSSGKSREKPTASVQAASPSALIDGRIEELGDWRGEMLLRVRLLIHQADPEVVEEWKWRGVPVWSHDGILCTGETYKDVVKMTFAQGASLPDPAGLFNASLEGNTRRAIDFRQGDNLDQKALKALIRAAVALNQSKARR